MATLWFALAALMLAIYVVMDGFDFGAGALHLAVARSDAERRQVLAAIGPFWDGNEVWLLAAGGALLLSFPKVLASALSGFYLAIFLFVWSLILRGAAIELRSHVRDAMWRAFWDGVFVVASTLAPIVLGAALGNVLRGVPLGADGWFALPLFESFSPRAGLGILDWYTVLCGATALVVLLHHGALFLAWKTDGAVGERSRAWAGRLFPVVLVAWLAATAATASVAPAVLRELAALALAGLATILFVGGLASSFLARRRGRDLLAFLGSAAFVLGLLAATAAAVYPTWLPSTLGAEYSLTVDNAAAGASSLATGLFWWPFGLALAIVYVAVLFRLHRGPVLPPAEGEGY